MPYVPGPATPAQVARHGHVAALLRSHLTARKWTPADFNAHLGWPRGSTSIYIWLAAKGGPGPSTRKTLAKALHVAEEALESRGAAAAKPAAVQRETVKASKSVVSFDALDARVRRMKNIWGRHYPESDPEPVRHESVSRETDPLVVRITPSGDMHIRLDVTLPLEPGSVLLRMLLDMNLVVKSEASSQ